MRPDALLLALALFAVAATMAYVSVYHPRSVGRAVGR